MCQSRLNMKIHMTLLVFDNVNKDIVVDGEKIDLALWDTAGKGIIYVCQVVVVKSSPQVKRTMPV